MSSGTGEKTEQPTEKRLEDARKEGQVARSRDLTSAVLLIAVTVVVWFIGSYIGSFLQTSVKEQIEFAAVFKGEFNNETVYNILWRGLQTMIWILSPLFFVILVFSFLGNYLQVGTIFSFQSISPKFEKLNPSAVFKQKFLNSRLYIELVKNIFKIIIAAFIAGFILWTSRESIVRLISRPPDVVISYTFSLILEICLKIGIVFLVLGVADYFIKRYLHRKDLKMTRAELKEEIKETEGNPLVKSQRQALHREILSVNLSAAVRESDVVLTNPSHVSIALKYEQGKNKAPIITAKGADLMAVHIRQIAAESGVPIKRDISLARALFKFDVKDEVPEEFYEAVAAVLQWVYSESRERAVQV